MGERPAMSTELVLLVIATAGAGVAALFAFLGFLRTKQFPGALTAQGATQILRAETDIVRAAVEDQARGLRQELGQSLKGFQELTLAAFGALRDGIDAQVRGFGERLDGGTKAIDERAAAISTKLNDEMAQMRSEANTNRETLRTLIEQKLDDSIGQQADASKVLRDELGGNFHRLGTRVSESALADGKTPQTLTVTITILTIRLHTRNLTSVSRYISWPIGIGLPAGKRDAVFLIRFIRSGMFGFCAAEPIL